MATFVDSLSGHKWDLLTRSGFEGYLEPVEGKHRQFSYQTRK